MLVAHSLKSVQTEVELGSRTSPFGHMHNGPVGVCLHSLLLQFCTEHSFKSHAGLSSAEFGQSDFPLQICVMLMHLVDISLGQAHSWGRQEVVFLQAWISTDSSEKSPQSS
jgi:hypothetical protein